jgi:hypothetical protein
MGVLEFLLTAFLVVVGGGIALAVVIYAIGYPIYWVSQLVKWMKN